MRIGMGMMMLSPGTSILSVAAYLTEKGGNG